ncbi:MAG: hypothetical protein PS018_11525 [bacterium]|nr:hypothetical protein [bacterium]
MTAMQRAFSSHMAVTGDATYSAEKAGYSSPSVLGGRLARQPDVAEDVRRKARHLLVTRGAEVGVRVLIELAEDTKQKGSTRGAAAKSLVQLSGVAGAQSLTEQDLAEMPADKIRALLGEAERALADRMAKLKTIEHEPAEQPQSAQAAPSVFE